MAGARPRLGLLCLPRSVESAVADARLAEDVGFSMVGVADSQSVFREMYATLALCAQATRRVRLGPAVTNPITRHPAVAASAIATVDEIARGRAFFGIGSGDSAILNLAERPSTLGDIRTYTETVRALLTTGEAEWRDRTTRLTWVKRAIPIYLSAEGPRTLQLAGEIADGVIVNVGLDPALVRDALTHVHAGARRAGRDPASIDLWTMVRANVVDDVAAGVDEIRMELRARPAHLARGALRGGWPARRRRRQAPERGGGGHRRAARDGVRGRAHAADPRARRARAAPPRRALVTWGAPGAPM